MRWATWLRFGPVPVMARTGAAAAELAGQLDILNAVDRLERLTVADRLLVLNLMADAYPNEVAKVLDWAEVDPC